jgi:CHAT domain-containing protein
VATHGFFASPDIRSALIPQGEVVLYWSADFFSRRKLSDLHPGLLSGLALTGANRPDPKRDDGLVTAEEVGAMNLSQTDLVVLSACDTGLGEVAGGEGLLGLQRAFQVAGARSVVASMWKVHDHATMLLMKRFYRNMWDKRMGKLEALREAQLWMLREGSAHVKKSTGKNTKTATKPTRLPPFFWGAFVLSGDWR